MTEMRIFKLKEPFTIHYHNGARRLEPGVVYTDHQNSIEQYAKSGAQVMVGDDLGNVRDVLPMVPRGMQDFSKLTLLAYNGGYGDMICREPALRWLRFPEVLCKHDQLGLVPGCKALPVELKTLEGRVVVDWRTSWNRIPSQFVPLQRCHAREIGIDPGDDYEWRVHVMVNDGMKKAWGRKLEAWGIPRPWVMVQVAASNYVRTYPPAMLFEALGEVKRDVACGVVLVGFDGAIPQALAPMVMGKGYYSALGQTKDSEAVVALLANADLIVTPASGACHVGEALKIDTVLINAIYPRVYEAGEHPKLHLVQSPAECAEADFTKCRLCKNERMGIRDCWWQLTPGVVARRIKEAIACLQTDQS